MGQQITFGFDAEVTLQSDGSYRVDPGKLQAKGVEDWRPLVDVKKNMPYKAVWRNRALLIAGVIRGRQRMKRGNWEVEMNSLRAYYRDLEG